MTLVEKALDPTETPEFKSWFAGSQAVDDQGKPLKLYHGTSKDGDFRAFRIPKNGVWFTPNPAEASMYAEDNDSVGFFWDHSRGYVRKHTASRVMPVYIRAMNPKYLEQWPAEIKNAGNYKRAQGAYFDQLRAAGYDSVILDPNMVFVVLSSPDQIKSAISSRYDPAKKNIDEEALTESVTVMPGVKEVKDGHTHIGWPGHAARREMMKCEFCNGTGKDIQSDGYESIYGKPLPCEMCDGKGERMDWIMDFPELNLSNFNAAVLPTILGYGEADSGWVPPEAIPDVKRRIIRLKNGDTTDLTRSPSEEKGPTRVDRSGDVPRITTGPLMIDAGVSQSQVDRYLDRLMAILDWAQQNGTGIYWA